MSPSPPGEDRLPVLIGVGHGINRPASADEVREPAALIADAVAGALDDARIAGGDLRRIDVLDVVSVLSWSYGDPVGAVGSRCGLDQAVGVTTAASGDQPTLRIAEAARRIAAGEIRLAVVCGGEAARSRSLHDRIGGGLGWTPEKPSPVLVDYLTGLAPAAIDHGLVGAPRVYALFENARRVARGQSLAEAQAESARIWSVFSRVAATTPGAWQPVVVGEREIAVPGDANRRIAFPYTKLMCANPTTDQSAAVVVASVAEARRLGVPRDQWVHLHAEAGAADTTGILDRPTYAESAALKRTLAAVLELAAVEADAIDLFELYSCFPVVPKHAAEMLGIGLDVPLSVCGGLTFFGGPGCAYTLCAAVAMVRRLRAGEGRMGLLHANGEYLTKEHAVVVGRDAPPGGVYRPDTGRANRQAELAQIGQPRFALEPSGAGTVETYTVGFDREGAVDVACVVGRLEDGQRFLAEIHDSDLVAVVVSGAYELVGACGVVRPGVLRNVFVLE